MTINKPADLMVEGGPRHDMECERCAMCTVLKMRHVHEAILLRGGVPRAGAALARSDRQQSCQTRAAFCHPWRSGSRCWVHTHRHAAQIGAPVHGRHHVVQLCTLPVACTGGPSIISLKLWSVIGTDMHAVHRGGLSCQRLGELTSNEVLSMFVLAARRRSEKDRPSSNPPADKA